MTIRQQRWEANPNNSKVLMDLISSPIFQEAIALLAEKNKPALVTGATAITDGAVLNGYHAGLNEFVPELLRLVKVETSSEQESARKLARTPFEHVTERSTFAPENPIN